MIFYVISNTHSKIQDKQFNEQLLGSAFVTETVLVTADGAQDVKQQYNVARLRDGRTNSAVKIGRLTKNSVTSERSTHNVATARAKIVYAYWE